MNSEPEWSGRVPYLEDGDQCTPEGIEIVPRFLFQFEDAIEFASEHLHAQQGKDDDEQKQEEQERCNGFHRV